MAPPLGRPLGPDDDAAGDETTAQDEDGQQSEMRVVSSTMSRHHQGKEEEEEEATLKTNPDLVLKSIKLNNVTVVLCDDTRDFPTSCRNRIMMQCNKNGLTETEM